MKSFIVSRAGRFSAGAVLVVCGVAILAAMASQQISLRMASNIPAELALQGPNGKDGVLAAVALPGGVVKYAFRSDEQLSSAPSDKILAAAQREDLNVTDEIIDRRTSHTRTFGTNRPNVAVTEIIGGDPQYYEDENGAWSLIGYATTSEYAFNQQMNGSPLFASLFFDMAFAQSIFYAEDNASVTVDGVLYQSASCEAWSSIRSETDASSVNDTATSEEIHVRACGSSDEWDRLHRFAAGFDTSSIPDMDTITSATESWYVTSVSADSSTLNQALGITAFTPAADDALATGDYDEFGSTRLTSDIDVGSLTPSAYNNWAFNGDGLDYINKSGRTNTMLRMSGDIDNSSPTWAANEETSVGLSFADTSGTSQDPKLVVVHEELAVDLTTRKSADESVTNSTTLQDDDHLKLTLEASKTYIIDGVIFASSTVGTADIKIAFTGPSGSNIKIGHTTALDNGLLQTSGLASAKIDVPADVPSAIVLKGTVTTSSAGELKLRWAQDNGNANPTIVGKGSYLRAQEI